MWNFQERIFLQNTSRGCFCLSADHNSLANVKNLFLKILQLKALVFFCKFLHIFRTTASNNTSDRLLLTIELLNYLPVTFSRYLFSQKVPPWIFHSALNRNRFSLHDKKSMKSSISQRFPTVKLFLSEAATRGSL